MLFNEDNAIRDETVSRLCWLLASQGDSRDLLPRINNLFDKSLSLCCQIKHVYDINKVQATQHYYQVTALNRRSKIVYSNNPSDLICFV